MDYNSNIHLGLHYNNNEDPHDPTTLLRKRSSLKPRSSIKEPNFKHVDQNALKKRITWCATGEVEGENNTKDCADRNYNEAKTHFVSEFVKK